MADKIMSTYQHTQPGNFSRITFGALIVLLLVVAAYLGASDTEAILVLGLMAAAAFIGLLLFHALTVEIRHGYLRVRFGVGLIRKQFRVKDIDSAEIIRTRWWYGWGIKLTPRGWLFSVSGHWALHLSMKNGRQYCIGTDEPDALLAAVEAAQRYG